MAKSQTAQQRHEAKEMQKAKEHRAALEKDRAKLPGAMKEGTTIEQQETYVLVLQMAASKETDWPESYDDIDQNGRLIKVRNEPRKPPLNIATLEEYGGPILTLIEQQVGPAIQYGQERGFLQLDMSKALTVAQFKARYPRDIEDGLPETPHTTEAEYVQASNTYEAGIIITPSLYEEWLKNTQ